MLIRNRLGLVTDEALRREGLSPEMIEGSVRAGDLEAAGPGLYYGPNSPTHIRDAISTGWRPTCISAAIARELWVPPTAGRELHAYRVRSARRTAPGRVLPHGWHDSWPEPDALATVPQLLRHATRCLDLESCVVLAESALHQRRLTTDMWSDIVGDAPRDAQPVLSRVATTSESGSESRVRFGLESHRVPVEAQVAIDGVGRVDLCVKDMWIIECDSRQHHSAEADYIRDRQRDLLLQAMGYLVTRLSYPQMWGEWHRTLPVLLEIFRSLRRRERRPLVTRGG